MKSKKYGHTQEIIVPIIIVFTIISGIFNFTVLKQKESLIKDINSFIINYKSKENKIPDTYTLKSNDNTNNVTFKIEENEKFYIIKDFNYFYNTCSPMTDSAKIDGLSIICNDNDIYIVKDKNEK